MAAVLHASDYAVMAAYLLGMATIGYACSSSKAGGREFLLGGGRLPYAALGISCLMAALSAFSLVTVPGEIFNHGLSFWALSLLTPLFALATCAIFMRFYFKIGAFTPFEYLERRYGPAVRTLVASLTLYLRLIYVGMVLFSTSKIFEGAAGWDGRVTTICFGLAAIVFAAAGGLKAVVWTDVMQFVVLTGGLACILAALSLKNEGGLADAIGYAFAHGRGLSRFAEPEFYGLNPYVRLSFWLLLLGNVTGAVSVMASDQMTVQRLLASGSYKNAVKANLVNSLLTIPTILVLWVIGLATFAYFHRHPEFSVKSGDTALFAFIATQLPPPLPGLVIAAMMAAVISTLNAVYNSMATVYLKELHQRYFNPRLDDARQVRVTRAATVVFGALSVGLGLLITISSQWLRQSVVEASTIFNVFDAIVIPAFLFAALSRRASARLVWVTAGTLWGLKFAMITWYSLSNAAVKDWRPGLDMGWAGPLDWTWAAFPLAAGLLLFTGWVRLARRNARGATLSLLAACMAGGYGAGLLVWAGLSRRYITDTPLAVSFQWLGFPSMVCYAALGLIWLTLGPVQEKSRYQGLTLFDPGELAGGTGPAEAKRQSTGSKLSG